ncbi:MAG: hypothetical protein JO168_26050 [Solirubrobacterales bacterium]|nr:hypothetical protein [Solirubrobacterales bacterium]
MSPESVLLGVLTRELATTSDLYERVGYGTLVRVGLIPYHAFRAELVRLEGIGAVASAVASDGSTVWRLTSESAPDGDPPLD